MPVSIELPDAVWPKLQSVEIFQIFFLKFEGQFDGE